jgi:hypothetical protein
MLAFIIACNVLAMVALALAFRARAVLLGAPMLATINAGVLLLNGFGALEMLIWLCICLAAGQAAFLLTSVLEWLFFPGGKRPTDHPGESKDGSVPARPPDYSPAIPLPWGSRTKEGDASIPRHSISSWKSPDM